MDTPKEGPRAGVRPVRVTSIGKNTASTVRFLDQVRGVLIHRQGKVQKPCTEPDPCPGPYHRWQTLWKGYAPAEVWSQQEQVWWPTVLEVTEALEESLRGHALRGSSWLLTRPQPSEKPCPVLGRFLKRYPDDQVRKPFPIEPVLCRLFHVASIRLETANPLQPKILLEAATGPGPDELFEEMADDPKPPTTEEWRNLRAQMKGFGIKPKGESNNGRQSEAAQRNGKH